MARKGKKFKNLPGLQKKAKKILSPRGLTSHQSTLQEAMVLQQTGRLPQAEALYRQVLQAEPENPEALYRLGMLAQQVGKNAIAVELITRAIAGNPDIVDAYINLGILHKNQGNLEEAASNFHRALALKPEIALLHFNLGVILHDQGKIEEAIASYRQALSLQPDFVEAYCNLGITLKGQGKIDEAIACFRQALSLKPNYAMVYINLGEALISQGKLEEAIRSMQIAVEKAPGDNRISDHLFVLLNYYVPDIKMECPYIEAQKSLQEVRKAYISNELVTDESVREIYQQCRSILDRHKLDIHTNKTELLRGCITGNDCRHHMMLFNKFNIIPRRCFDCYKVIFEPRTVMELFKLLFVFDKLKLPNDNPRKCMVEVRPGVAGHYKGFIYCKSIKEGEEILNSVHLLVEAEIIKGLPIGVKRGCTEFLAAFPAYGHMADNKIQPMSYNEEWIKYEEYADKNMKILFKEPNKFTYNHSGFTLLDVLVMHKWLEYAAKIGDSSYLKIV